MRHYSLPALAALAFIAMGLGSVALGASPAVAATGSFTDAPAALLSIEDDTEDRTFDVALGGRISAVTVALDFIKVENDCADPGAGLAFNEDLGFRLTSPDGTSVVLIADYTTSGGAPTYPDPWMSERVRVVLDDAAADPVGSPDGRPGSGTFRPAEPLGAFAGENPDGIWTLTAVHDFIMNPLCYYGASLDIETQEAPPAPTAHALAITPSTLAVDQGGSVEFAVTATDSAGDPVDVQGEYVLASSVGTDVVAGDRVTFPTASTHTITATHLPTGLTASALVQVRPPHADDELAATGSDEARSAPLIGVGIGLAGAGALLASRLRRAR